MQTRGCAALLSLALAAAAAGCTTAASDSLYFGKVTPPDGQNLRYVTGSEPESLDPQIATGQPEARIFLALFDGLTELDPKTALPIPSLATSWEPNGDNTVFTFHLRDAVWSDGTPITADDFVYSFRRGLSPALAARNAYLGWDILNAEAYTSGQAKAEDVGVDAIDAHTLRIRLQRPIPFLPGLMTNQFFRPVPRQAVEAWGDRWTDPDHIVTSGPFLLQTHRPVRHARRRPQSDGTGTPASSGSTRSRSTRSRTRRRCMNLYKAGEVDAVYNHTVPSGWIGTVEHFKDYRTRPSSRTCTSSSTRRAPRRTTCACGRRSTWRSTRPASRSTCTR